MAEVVFSVDEAVAGKLPEICMRCGAQPTGTVSLRLFPLRDRTVCRLPLCIMHKEQWRRIRLMAKLVLCTLPAPIGGLYILLAREPTKPWNIILGLVGLLVALFDLFLLLGIAYLKRNSVLVKQRNGGRVKVLSPTNKIRGSRGRVSFMEKRQEVLNSDVHWVEIDLLRAGVPSVTHPPLVPSDYRAMVSRANARHRARYWPISVRQNMPVIGIPLRGDDPDAALDLGAVLKAAYDRAAYDLSLDYGKDPHPPLDGEDAAWAKKLVRTSRSRKNS